MMMLKDIQNWFCCRAFTNDTQFLSVERCLLLAWLLKDFGWMTTNVWLGFPFGIISVGLHMLFIFFDPRKSFMFYNISLLFWVTGNFMWMSAEFIYNEPSSYVHIGPPVPLGGFANGYEQRIVDTKSFFFMVGVIVQITMYMMVYFKKVPMPTDYVDSIDLQSTADLHLLCLHCPCHAQLSRNADMCCNVCESTATGAAVGVTLSSRPATNASSPSSNTSMTSSVSSPNSALSSPWSDSSITLAYFENGYIIFWIMKDMFWSFGTGDLSSVNDNRDLIILFEVLALWAGLGSVLICIAAAYLYRQHMIRFLDSVTVVCWIVANYVWMTGEFFIRYQNLTLDDENEGKDDQTRIAAALLFCIGISIQVYVIALLVMKRIAMDIPRGSSDSLEHLNTNNTFPWKKLNPLTRLVVRNIAGENPVDIDQLYGTNEKSEEL